MRLSLCLLALTFATGCAAVNTPRHPHAYEEATAGRPGWIRLEAPGTEPWLVFVCEDSHRCSFYGLFRPGQMARIRWRAGDRVMVTDGTEHVQTPQPDGRVFDVDTCRPFTGEVRVTTGMHGDTEPVQTRRFRAASERRDGDCRHSYSLVEMEG